ncbi:MAG: hypothetical protein HY569_02225 [Candidatus Magasanikbacteria bacterium]|nr:hypothetical protein [Candidatus Magasanikbacteria bacterium]
MREVIGVADRLGGEEGVKRLLASCRPIADDLEEPKYAGETLGRWEAILNLTQKFGTDVLDRWLAGELEPTFVGVVRAFFDQHGRFIPRSITASHTDPNRDFSLAPPNGGWEKYDLVQLNLSARVARLASFVPSDAGLILPTAEEVCGFLARCEAIRVRVRDDKTVANILNGPNLPTFLPKFRVGDLGTFVELLVTIVKRSYEAQFPGRTFYNHRVGDLVGKVSVVEASRFQQVISEMAHNHVSGLDFLTPFQGFSIPADHEAVALLPEEFILSGLDTFINWALYPDILLPHSKTPGYDLAAFFWGSSLSSLCGEAGGGDAGFGGGDLSANDDCSAGLFLSR